MIEPNNLLSDALLESRRFGLRVVHGAYDRLPVGDLRRALIAARADVAIIRVPTDAPDTMASLQRLGLDFLVADTLVYYLSDLSKYEPLALRNRDLVFSLATDLNREELAALVRVTFEGYRNHYFSNPLFTKEKILEGYEEWATSFITAGNDRQLWLVRREGRLVAFAACSVAQGGDAAEGVLFAVDADAAGGGIYGDLIRFTQRQYRSRGCSKMYVSTQVHNYAVQKVWMREGFHMVSSWLTLHINALLSHSTRPIEEFDLAVTPDLIASYAETTGDRNPIHLDDGAAKRAGLRGAIAHGLLATAVASRYFGTEDPGHGTLFEGYRYRFYAPLYVGELYRVRISFPWSCTDGRQLGVSQVFSAQGELCLLGYSDLLHR